MKIFNYLGGFTQSLNFLLLLVLSYLIISLIRNKYAKLSALFFFIIVDFSQLLSLYFAREYIGARFLIHCKLYEISALSFLFKNHLVVLFLFILFCTIFLFFYLLKIKQNSTKKKSQSLFISLSKLIASVVIIVVMMLPNGLLNYTYNLLKSFSTAEKEFSQSLLDLDITNYTTPQNIKASKGKNIIILSLESYEYAYLMSEAYESLTPNFQVLKEKWNLYKMNPNYRADWTSGSLYTTMTGFPADFGYDGNSIFKNSYFTSINSLGNIVNKAGYDSKFYISDAKYSGTKDMLLAFQIHSIYDKYTSEKEKLFDSDLFNQLKKDLISDNKSPCMYYISTLDTHFPNGLHDNRMEKYVPNNLNQMDFAIKTVDYLIGDLYHFLEKNNLLENTVVYIFPDHLKMGYDEKLESTGKRGLFMLTNATNLSIEESDTIQQIQLPKLILQGANIKHNGYFLCDYMLEKKDNFKHLGTQFIALNKAGFKSKSVMKKDVKSISINYSKYKADKNRFIAHAGGAIDGYIYTNSLEALNHNYSKGFKLFELDLIETSDGQIVAAHDWDHWKKITNYQGKVPVDLKTFLQQKIHQQYTPLSMNEINKWFSAHPDVVLVTDKINKPKKMVSQFCDKNRLMMELFSKESIEEAISINFKGIMVSENVIEQFRPNSEEKFIKNNIKNVAVSYNFALFNTDMMKAYHDNGIKTYIFNLDYPNGVDEEFMIKYEMDNLFGIYANEMKF